MSASDEADAKISEALHAIREQVEHQLGVGRPPAVEVDPSTVVRFSPHLRQGLSREERHVLMVQADELHPWLQGPFLIAEDIVVGGTWRTDARWAGLGEHVPADISGKRVLDVGSNAGYDAFMFNLRGADYVLACEPFEFHSQALFLNSIYKTPVDFQKLRWQNLDPEIHGRFDIVHCNGVLYHELHPMLMLERLRAMVSDTGKLFLGSMILQAPEHSEYVRFVPCEYFGDPTWWWVPGRLAIRWMIETSGFVLEEHFGTSPGPPGEFRVATTYLVATPVDT
jgi:tRNA (mo5U34)-methyltransferase